MLSAYSGRLNKWYSTMVAFFVGLWGKAVPLDFIPALLGLGERLTVLLLLRPTSAGARNSFSDAVGRSRAASQGFQLSMFSIKLLSRFQPTACLLASSWLMAASSSVLLGLISFKIKESILGSRFLAGELISWLRFLLLNIVSSFIFKRCFTRVSSLALVSKLSRLAVLSYSSGQPFAASRRKRRLSPTYSVCSFVKECPTRFTGLETSWFEKRPASR